MGQGNIFTSMCQEFCAQGGSALVHAGIHPPRTDTPAEADPPKKQTTPPKQTLPPEQTPPRSRLSPSRSRQPPPPKKQTSPRGRPPQEAGSSIRSMSGRYASYWNAFLFLYRLSLIGQCERTLNSMRIIKEWRITQVACKFTKFSIANLNVLTCARLQRKRQRLMVSSSSPSSNINIFTLTLWVNVFLRWLSTFLRWLSTFLRWLATFSWWLSTFLRWLSN